MKRWAFWLRAVAVFLVLAALGALAATAFLATYFPEAKVRAMVIDAARRQLGREVRLEKIGVGPRGLTLRGVAISESPDFSAGTFASADLLRVRPSWRALLRRRLVVAAVTADGLSVRVVRRADGSYNFSNLASSTAAVPAPASTPAAPSAVPQFDVRRLMVNDASIDYEDRAGGLSWKADGLSLEIRGLGPAAPFDVAAAAHVTGRAGKRPIDAQVALDGTVDLAAGSRAGFTAEAKRLSIEQDGLRLEGGVRVARLDAPEVSFDVALSAAGRRLLRASATAKVGAAVDIDAKLSIDPLDAALLARLLPDAGLPAADFPAAELDASGTWSGSAASVRTARLSWGGGWVLASGTARGLGNAAPVFDGKVSFAADVPKIEPGQYPFLDLPPRLSLPAERAEGEAALSSGGDLTVKALTLRSALGTLTAAGTVRRATSAKPDPDLTIKTALSFPTFHAADLPFDSGLPPTLVFPSMRVDGGIVLSGEDVRFVKLTFEPAQGSVVLDGTLARALAGEFQPDLNAALDLTLPPLTDADLPFQGVPAGLSLPASRWTGGISYSGSALRLHGLRARVGRNDVEADGGVTDLGGRDSFDALFKCRSFDLKELTGLTPATRDLQLVGGGFFALAVTGAKGAKPTFAGKMRFTGLGATAAGLPLTDFSGTLSADPTRIDIPNLAGKIADGALSMDLTVKDYSRAPDVEFDAKLDRFDLGRYLDAKKRLLAEHPPTPAAAAAGSSSASARPLRTRGKLDIGALVYPSATVQNVHASWDLWGITPDLRALNGEAHIAVGGGKLQNVGDMATQSKILKVLIFPLLIVQKLGRIGGLRFFPDYNDIDLRELLGDYSFKDGLMTLNRSEMDSNVAAVSATGTIDLPAEKLALVVAAQVANIAPIDVDVTGTFDDPKSKVRLGKFLIEGVKHLINPLGK